MTRTKKPNTKCCICKKPISREPWRIKKSDVYCVNCRIEYLKTHPKLYENMIISQKTNPSHLGKKFSIETKKKMSIANKKGYLDGSRKVWNIGLTSLTSDKVKKIAKLKIGKKRPDITGDKHFNWKGGIKRRHLMTSDRLERERFSQEIRRIIFNRDNFICQICNKRSGDLQVDHIKSWVKHPELRFSLNNCRTICVPCHYKITYHKDMPPGLKGWGHNLLKGGQNY